MSSYGELANTIIQQKGAGSRFAGLNTALDLRQAHADAMRQYQMASQLKQQETFGTGLAHIYGSAAMTGMPVDPNTIQDYSNAVQGNPSNIATGNTLSTLPDTTTNNGSNPGVTVSNTPDNPNGITATMGQVRNEAALQKLSPVIAAKIKQIADYQAPITSVNRTQQTAIGGLVKLYDPSYDATKYTNRQAFMKDWNQGKFSDQRQALENLSQHLELLSENYKALDNGNLLMANNAKNTVAFQTGQEQVNNANIAMQGVGTEMIKTLRGSNIINSDQEDKMQKNLSSAASPDQQKGAIKEMLALAYPRINSVAARYKSVMGKAPTDVLTPEAMGAIQRLNPTMYNSLMGRIFGVGNVPDNSNAPSAVNKTSQNETTTTNQITGNQTSGKDYSSLWSK